MGMDMKTDQSEQSVQRSSALAEVSNVDKRSSTPTITSQAYVRLREDIINGALKPNHKLKIEELRKRYEVGTSTIREALSLLTSDHFVERIDQRGFKVAGVSASEFGELLKTRCWLEEKALRESISHGGNSWEEKVVLAAYRLTRVPRSDADDQFISNAEWETRHKQFHMTLISACKSSYLMKFCDHLYDQNVRYRQLAGKNSYQVHQVRDISAEHGAICDAALARSADLACELLIAHYVNTGEFLKNHFND